MPQVDRRDVSLMEHAPGAFGRVIHELTGYNCRSAPVRMGQVGNHKPTLSLELGVWKRAM
jgi:hypothetical protein